MPLPRIPFHVRFSDTVPAAPAGKFNVKWQSNSNDPLDVSAYVDPASILSGTTNRVAKFTSAHTIGDSLLLDSGSNVFLTSGSFDINQDLQGIIFGSSQYIIGDATNKLMLHYADGNPVVAVTPDGLFSGFGGRGSLSAGPGYVLGGTVGVYSADGTGTGNYICGVSMVSGQFGALSVNRIGGSAALPLKIFVGGHEVARFDIDGNIASGETDLWIRRNDSGTYTLDHVKWFDDGLGHKILYV